MLRVLVAVIVVGRYEAGDRLPREADLAQQFAVSRGVARECLRGLEERGLVAVKHGRGATVRGEPEWDMFSPDVLSAILEGDRAGEVLGQYLECRRLLEIEAAALAAERAGKADLVALSDAFDRMTSSAAHAAGVPAAETLYHEADVAFHRAVIAATGNRPLGRMTEPVHRALAAARRPLARPDARIARSLPEHRRILTAIAEGDSDEARAAMHDHLRTVEGYLREYVTQGRSPREHSGV
jgi:GntR family transcriptional repressor for pyruvate dehydrogenase complex